MNGSRQLQLAACVAALLLGGATASAAAQGQPPAVATYSEGAQISARGSTLAVAEASGTSARLLLGFGGAPTPAAGAGPLPAWAQPSLGTDADGRAVVVYPRCSDPAAVATCDLYGYEIGARRERRLPGVNAAGVGEVDGVMTRGDVAFNRWPLDGAVPRRRLADETTRLMYRPAGGPARLLTRRGGRQFALRGRWIAEVRNLATVDAGSCGRPAVELISLGGQRRTARVGACGEQGRVPSRPRFVGRGDDVAWAESWGSDPGHLYRYRTRARRLLRTPTQVTFSTLALSAADAGWAVQLRYRFDLPPQPGPVPFVFDLVRVTGLPRL